MNDVARVSTIHECRHSRLADAHAAELVELVCAASDVPDETVELQMLKCLLTAVSSWTPACARERSCASSARASTRTSAPRPR